jgi:hypothetical protein
MTLSACPVVKPFVASSPSLALVPWLLPVTLLPDTWLEDKKTLPNIWKGKNLSDILVKGLKNPSQTITNHNNELPSTIKKKNVE